MELPIGRKIITALKSSSCLFSAFLATVVSICSARPALAQLQQTPLAPATSISDAIAQTLRTNPDSLAAAELVNTAKAAYSVAQSSRQFQLTFNSVTGVSSATVIQPPPSNESFGATQNSLSVPIVVGSKTDLLVNQAAQQLLEAQETYRSRELALASKVSDAYYDFLKKEALLNAAELDAATSNRELADAEARNNAGDIPQLDVLQAQVPVAASKAAVLQAQSAQSIALETLNDLLGYPLDQPLMVVDVTTPLVAPTYTLAQARSLALAMSPDVSAADAEVSANDAALDAAKRYADPSLSLQAIDLRSGDKTSFSREDTFQASVTVPLDDGGLGRATVRSAQSALNLAKLNAQSARKTAGTSVSSAYLSAISGLAELSAAQAAHDIAQATYEKTRLGYSAGLYPLSAAITAENEASLARTVYIQALYDAASAHNQLDLDVHGLPTEVTGKQITN